MDNISGQYVAEHLLSLVWVASRLAMHKHCCASFLEHNEPKGSQCVATCIHKSRCPRLQSSLRTSRWPTVKWKRNSFLRWCGKIGPNWKHSATYSQGDSGSSSTRSPRTTFEARACKLRPRQAALWPKRFCMDFSRTFGPSKSQLWGCRAAFWSGFRPERGRRTYTINETARDYTLTERSFENWI